MGPEHEVLRGEFAELQSRYVQSVDEVAILKEKIRKRDLEIENLLEVELAQYHKENKELILEVKDSHQVIEDLRERIDMLYEQINKLTHVNNSKNQELLSHISFLEE